MHFRDIPIKRKLTALFLLTSGAVLFLTCAAYFAYEFVTFRQTTRGQLLTLGQIIAANSTAALAFGNERDAGEILAALKAERHIVSAGLYDRKGKLFSRYPASLSADALPAAFVAFLQNHDQIANSGRNTTNAWARSTSSPTWERCTSGSGFTAALSPAWW